MPAPVVIKPIPPQIINEFAVFKPMDMTDFIESPEKTPNFRFMAELKSGEALPRGLICTLDGILTGIPAKGTSGQYDVILHAANDAGEVETTFPLTIKTALVVSATDHIDKLKAQVWQALEQHLPLPELAELYDRPITAQDIYYLLERWASLTVYDAYNLTAPGEKQLLTLDGASEHYHVYDRGSCLVGCPIDLFSAQRTLEDSLKTARAMAREVYKRGWTIELIGFGKMSRAAWVELQHLGDLHGKRLEVINFSPNSAEVKLYTNQAIQAKLRSGIE